MIIENIWIERIKLRYLLFTFICLGYFAYGCNTTLIGVSFSDLAAILDVDSEVFSLGITIRYIVNCFAAILAGFSFNLFSRQIQYAVSLFIYGLLVIMLPFIQNVAVYFTASGIIGLTSAFIDCVTNLWTFELFTEKINFHVLIVHFFYSAGQIVAPLVVRPYLSNQTSLSNKQIQESTRIHIPFLICGSFFIIVSFFILVCYFFEPYVPPKRYIESKNAIRLLDQTDKKQNDENMIIKSPLPSYYYNSCIVIISLILGFEIANELNLNYYLPTYLIKSDLRIDQDTGAYMMVLIGTAYCVGRLINILISIKIDVLIMLYVNLSLIVAGNLILTFLASNDKIYLTWISIILLGLGYSSTFPCLFAFIEQRITITNNLNSFLVFVTSSVFTINSLVIGNSIDKNPALFQYINSTFSILFVILFCLLHLTDFWKRKLLEKI